MKQYIDYQQWDELSNESKAVLSGWFFRNYPTGINQALPIFLSIGQMIDFLYSQGELHNFHTVEGCYGIPKAKGWHVVTGHGDNASTYDRDELCDALWEAIKVVLHG